MTMAGRPLCRHDRRCFNDDKIVEFVMFVKMKVCLPKSCSSMLCLELKLQDVSSNNKSSYITDSRKICSDLCALPHV